MLKLRLNAVSIHIYLMLDHRLRILEFTLKTVDSHGTLVFGGGEHQDEV